MTKPDGLAAKWATAMRQARDLDPDRMSTAIQQQADNGLRATRYDRTAPSTSVPCDEPERCHDGPDPHSHLTTSDPTGQAALHPRRQDPTREILADLNRASIAFVESANVVLDFVAGDTRSTWVGIVHRNAQLMPGTVQAGLDVDDERILPAAITATAMAVATVAGIAKRHLPRQPTIDERHWTSGLADEDCCALHLTIAPQGHYRRPRATGSKMCADCVSLVMLADGKLPPPWLIEAEVERLAKPRAWTTALGRWMDELGLAAS